MTNRGMTMEQKSIRAIAFVIRCAGAATVAYGLAHSLGLPESVWAAMSAVIVSQERLHETRSSLRGRVIGTLLGIIVTIMVSRMASHAAVSTAVQMAVAVAICALVTREHPKFRVAIWTCPIILLTTPPSVPVFMVAFRRGGEVILGAVVGWIFHWAAEILVDRLTDAARALSMRRPARRRAARRHSTPQVEGGSP